MMKKLVSILLFVTVLTTLLIPAFTAFAAESANPSAQLTFDDWKDPFAPPADRYTQVATTVESINNNPTAIIYPLKGAENWNHVTMPLMFTRGKTYVVSYDATILEQPGASELKDARLVPFVNCTVYSSDSAPATLGSTQRILTFDNGCSDTVKPGVWTHTTATVYIPSDVWWTPDSFGFYENQDSLKVSSTFAIDNLVIMEQSEFNVAYPNGVAARTDDPSVGYDKIVADFDHTRYTVFRSSNAQKGRLSVTLRGDSVLTWDRSKDGEQDKETCLNIPFNFTAGKTYRVGFDLAANAAGAGTKLELAASATILATDANAALQKFAAANAATVVTLADANWLHVDMTLTPTADAKYFTLLLDEASVALAGKLYFDNFALAEDSAFPSDMPLRTAGIDNVARETFDKDTASFYSVFWGTNNKLSVDEVVRGELRENVLNWQATGTGKSYNKLNVSYCFTKNKTYVISFDAMLYGMMTADGISSEGLVDTAVAIFTVNQDWTHYEAGTNHGQVVVKAGEWSRVSLEITIPDESSRNYLGLCELTANDNNGCIYIDNFTVAEKKEDCSADSHVAGVWTNTKQVSCAADGEQKLICAICGEVIETRTIPMGRHLPGGEWIVDEETSCSKAGSQHKNCTVCGQVAVTEEIAKLEHTAGEWVTDKEATCTEDGKKHADCTVCGEQAVEAAIDALGHTHGKWVVEKEAAVGADGYRYKSCTVCGVKVADEVIPALSAPATEATAETPAATDPADSKQSGCNGSIGMGGLALLGILSMAGVMLGKKK